ncbi:MAG: SAM-dependent methyltransferase [Clostridia bacterium]|nr:SAM-dependent methyltransferase [Clostridia bacterium]
MNKKQGPKITLFINSLIEKYTENKDFFIGGSLNCLSGRKEYKGTLISQNDEIVLNFMNISKKGKGISDYIGEMAPLYDEIIFTYEERQGITIITASEKGVFVKKELSKNDFSESSDNPLLKDHEYILKLPQAEKLLKVIGILTEDGKLKNSKIHKYNQVDRFLMLAKDYIEETDGVINIIDCACGKSYLSFVLNYYICEVLKRKCKVTGIDISENVIKESKRMAEELGYKNMTFIKGDLRTYRPEEKIHLCVSLHACDIATDMALGVALRTKADAFICVPCCHKELIDKYRFDDFSGIRNHNLLNVRFNDIMTDSLRVLKAESMGYDISCVEFVSPLETPKNLMIRGKYTGKINKKSEEEYYNLLKKIEATPSIEIFSKTYI